MMKLIVLGTILYVYYHFYYKRSSLASGETEQKLNASDQEDDYIDYEEVD